MKLSISAIVTLFVSKGNGSLLGPEACFCLRTVSGSSGWYLGPVWFTLTAPASSRLGGRAPSLEERLASPGSASACGDLPRRRRSAPAATSAPSCERSRKRCVRSGKARDGEQESRQPEGIVLNLFGGMRTKSLHSFAQESDVFGAAQTEDSHQQDSAAIKL